MGYIFAGGSEADAERESEYAQYEYEQERRDRIEEINYGVDYNYILTAKQLGMILDLCRKNGLLASTYCEQETGKLPSDLSKREAAELITKLQNGSSVLDSEEIMTAL